MSAKSRIALALLFCCNTVNPSLAEAGMPNFENQGQGMPNYPKPEQRFVVMPIGVANMTAQHFALPKDTYTYPLAGMTVFPYYQASPDLKNFLNNTRVYGIPITNLPTTAAQPMIQLPGTDTVRISIPINPGGSSTKSSSSTQLARKDASKDEVPWLVSHRAGQSYPLPGDPSGMVLTSAGTIFNAADNRTLALRRGTMWVLTGPRPAAVLTRYGAVEVKPYSIVGVEQTWFNKVKVASLFGDAAALAFTSRGNHATLNIDPGKEITLNESVVASAGISDYTDKRKNELASLMPLTDLNLGKLEGICKKIDPEISAFLGEIKTVSPPAISPRISAAYKSMFEKYGITEEMRRDAARNQIIETARQPKQQAIYKASLDSRYFVPSLKPVTQKGSANPPEVQETLETLWVQHGVVKYLSNARLEIEREGRIALNFGEALFAAKEPMYVRARDCFINIKPGAVVQIISRKDLIIVRNLRELSNNSVLLKIKSRTIDAAAGNELIVAANAPATQVELKKDGVGRRNVRLTEFANGSIVINKCEIDLTSLLRYNPSMRLICESKDRFDKKLLSEIVKMDAVLSVVTGGHGSYHRMAGLPQSH